MIDKKRVCIHFERAARTYEKKAVIQLQMAEHLLSLIDGIVSEPLHFVLEIGCCTGNLTRRLVAGFPDIEVLHVNDLVKRFAHQIQRIDMKGELKFLPGDIEKIRLPQQYQLILSSSTFHWLHDFSLLVEKLQRHLVPGGILAFTIYGPKNLQEIRSLTGTGLPYLSLKQIVRLLERYLEVLVAKESVETFIFTDPYEVLQHFRQTGVNSLTEGGWSRSRLKKFVTGYQQLFKSQKGVSLTYHPMYFLARSLAEKKDKRRL